MPFPVRSRDWSSNRRRSFRCRLQGCVRAIQANPKAFQSHRWDLLRSAEVLTECSRMQYRECFEAGVAPYTTPGSMSNSGTISGANEERCRFCEWWRRCTRLYALGAYAIAPISWKAFAFRRKVRQDCLTSSFKREGVGALPYPSSGKITCGEPQGGLPNLQQNDTHYRKEIAGWKGGAFVRKRWS